jgi:hypothetical protein
MKRVFMATAAVALLLIVTESAHAQRWVVGGGYGYGGPYYGVSYGTRVGNSGFLSVGYAGGGYPSYGYVAPAYYATPVYAAPVYYSTPYYYSPYYYSRPYYGYGGPNIGFSYGWGGRGWRW